jgi:predicted lipoprotein with Yx(FWY)xxD motif
VRSTLAFAILLSMTSPAWAQEAPALSIAETPALGQYLVGPDGRPVYAFVTEEVRGGNDLAPLTACIERCLEDWPLVTLEATDFVVAEGVDPGLAESLEWEGHLVLVYASRELFYYARDAAGEAPEGQELHEWGGWWYLLRPDGSLIRTGVAPDPEA